MSRAISQLTDSTSRRSTLDRLQCPICGEFGHRSVKAEECVVHALARLRRAEEVALKISRQEHLLQLGRDRMAQIIERERYVSPPAVRNRKATA